MPRAQASIPKVHETLQSFRHHKRLAATVRNMAREIERLDNDNTQLRAAISMYRETLRRLSGDSPAS